MITSPCYLSAIEYWRRHKLEYSWLGLVKPEHLNEVKHTFLGMGKEVPLVDDLPNCVRKLHDELVRLERRQDAKVLARYFNDSSKWLTEVAAVLRRSNGVAYVVAGSNTNHGFCLDTPLTLQQVANDIGFSVSSFMRYQIKNSYMQYPTKGARIKVETVLKLAIAS